MNYIDLFSGCGGLSLGLHNAGLHGLFAVEKNEDAFRTLKFNLIDRVEHFDWPKWLPVKNHNIDALLEKQKTELMALRGKVDLIVGGPPCQGFSLAGRRQKDDKRNHMVASYIKMVKLIHPRYILLENVKGFTIPFHKGTTPVSFRDNLVNELQDMGYDIDFKLIDFSSFGVPQKRVRFILVGVLNTDVKTEAVKAASFFKLLEKMKAGFFEAKRLTANPTVEDAISDLFCSNGTAKDAEVKRFSVGQYGATQTSYQRLMRSNIANVVTHPDSHRFARHTTAIAERFKIAIAKKMTPSVYRKHFKLLKSSTKLLMANMPTPTLTTLPDDYIHYCEPRILTVREYARIQSFPDDYEFKGKYTTGGKRRVNEVPRYTQVGNAIPPLFGELAGQVLREMAHEH